jgi:serine/threonine protein kinase
MPLQNGQTLQNRYRVLQSLGKGGMGSVYLAEDGRLGGKHVAIKEFDPTVLPPQDRQWAANAFAQEANILARLSHPALTAVTDYFAENHLFYLVMEYVPGETLESAWQRQPGNRFAPQQVAIWARQLCEVLDYLHSQNQPVIFRDLKPANIMVLSNGRLKLIDFGIARYFAPGKTRDTITLGTPGYAAPEQHGQAQADARSDIYSLGVVLHQLLTGYDPATTPFHLPPVRSLTPSVPVCQARAIEQALSLNREQRPTSAPAFYELFQPQQEVVPATGNWLWGVVGLFLVALIGGLGGFWLLRDQSPTSSPTANARMVPTDAPTFTPAGFVMEETAVVTRTLIATVTVPATSEVVEITQAADEPTVTLEPLLIMCTPPACAANEVYFCRGDCPGGCGTVCATVTPPPQPAIASWELGRSAGGRGIPITQIGTGAHKIILIGTVRGGETPNSEALVNRLQEHFLNNPTSIPLQVALYFIPVLNPDGRADGRRFNANGVDLNRNWDTPSWKADTNQPGGVVRNSGGARPFSEPETQSLRDLLQTLLSEGESVTVIAYHYHVGISGQGTVQPGYHTYYSPVQLSVELAHRLEQAAGYAYLPYWSGSYIPSGELIQWCAMNGIAVVDVELPRGVTPDSRPSGQTRTVFEAALASVNSLFER